MTPMLLLAGPSAVGKTTVMEHLLRLYPAFTSIRSMTTRPARSATENEYLHVDDDAFLRAVQGGELLEHTIYGAYRYGTPVCELVRAEACGRVPLLILELTGVHVVKAGPYAVQAVAVYLYDDLPVMAERLRARNTDADGLMRRLQANARDYAAMPGHVDVFDALIRNDATPAETAHAVLAVFNSRLQGRCPMSRADKLAAARALAAQADALPL